MDRVTSKDGTSIAYEHDGRGPAVILVGGAIDDGSENAPLIPELAENFGLQLRSAWPGRKRRHSAVHRGARDRGPAGAHR